MNDEQNPRGQREPAEQKPSRAHQGAGPARPVWRRVFPILCSLGLLAWVVGRVSLSELAGKVAELDWPKILLATSAMVLGLYFWDAFCLRWLFSTQERKLPYATALDARGRSYLASAWNYELGQGLLALLLANGLGISLLLSLGFFVLLALHDLVVLLGLGLLGALLSSDPGAPGIRLFCLVGLSLIFGLGSLVWLLPRRWQEAWKNSRWGVGWTSWSWVRSFRLCLLRTSYYGIILFYTLVSLGICGIWVDFRIISSVIPLVLLADGLPISISGLGTRETALLYLLQPEQSGVLLAFSLIWSLGLMTGRLLIGLGFCLIKG